MANEPQAVLLAQSFQQELQSANAKVIEAMTRRWGAVESNLQGTIDALADELAQLNADGVEVPRWKLFQLERYQSLLAQIQAEIAKYQQWAIVQLMDDATTAQNQARRDAQRLLGTYASGSGLAQLDFAFDKLGVESAEKIAALAQAGKPLDDILSSAYPLSVNGITDRLIQGASLGWNPRKTARLVMRDGLAQGLNHVLLVARDQQIRNYREAQRDAYKASGLVWGYKRLAAKNSRTCIACLALDGEIFSVDVVMPLHPQDRCSSIPLIIGRPIPQWKTGREWFEEQSADVQRGMMGAGRYELWKDGQIRVDQMLTVKPNRVWGDSAQVTTVKALREGLGGYRVPEVRPIEVMPPKKAKTVALDTLEKETLKAVRGEIDKIATGGLLTAAKKATKNAEKGQIADFQLGEDGKLKSAVSYDLIGDNWMITAIGGVTATDVRDALQRVAKEIGDEDAESLRLTVPNRLIQQYSQWGFDIYENKGSGAVMGLNPVELQAFASDPDQFQEEKKEVEEASALFSLNNDFATATFKTGVPLDNLPFKAASPLTADEISALKSADLATLPPLDVPKGKHAGAGMILIDEATGKIVTVDPAGGFGGYQTTLPKGTQEKGQDLQETAIRETFEETGFKAKIIGHLGDYEKTTSVNRFYIGVIDSGAPWAAHWETQAVNLTPLDIVAKSLNNATDQPIIADFEKVLDEVEQYGGDLATALGKWEQEKKADASAEKQEMQSLALDYTLGSTLALSQLQKIKVYMEQEGITAAPMYADVVNDINAMRAPAPMGKREVELEAMYQAVANGDDLAGVDRPKLVSLLAYANDKDPDIAEQIALLIPSRKSSILTFDPSWNKKQIAQHIADETGVKYWQAYKTMTLPTLKTLDGMTADAIAAEVEAATQAYNAKYSKKTVIDTARERRREPEPVPTLEKPDYLNGAKKKELVAFFMAETGGTKWKIETQKVAELEALFGKTHEEALAAFEAGAQAYYDKKKSKTAANPKKPHATPDQILAKRLGVPASMFKELDATQKAELMKLEQQAALVKLNDILFANANTPAAFTPPSIPAPTGKKANQYAEQLVKTGAFSADEILAAIIGEYPKSIFALANVKAKFKKLGVGEPSVSRERVLFAEGMLLANQLKGYSRAEQTKILDYTLTVNPDKASAYAFYQSVMKDASLPAATVFVSRPIPSSAPTKPTSVVRPRRQERVLAPPPKTPTTYDVTGANAPLINKLKSKAGAAGGSVASFGDKAISQIASGAKGFVYEDADGNMTGVISLSEVAGKLKISGAGFNDRQTLEKGLADVLVYAKAQKKSVETWVSSKLPDEYKVTYGVFGFGQLDQHNTVDPVHVPEATLDKGSATVVERTDAGPLSMPPGVTAIDEAKKLNKTALVDHVSAETGITKTELKKLTKGDLISLIGLQNIAPKVEKMVAKREAQKAKKEQEKKEQAAYEAFRADKLTTSKQAVDALAYASTKGLAASTLAAIGEEIDRLRQAEKEASPFLPKFEPRPLPPTLPTSAELPTHADFPKDPAKLTIINANIGGTTGAKLVEDPSTGKRYIMKSGANQGHLEAEMAADAVYQAAGLRVPRFQSYDTPNGTVKLAEFVEGEPLSKAIRGKHKKRIIQQLQDGFAADALLANFDVLGADMDNVLVDKDGNVWRIDNGGSFSYRAQGGKKKSADYPREVLSIWNMRSNPQNFGGAARHNQRIYEDVGIYEIARQVRDNLLTNRDKILAATPPDERAQLNARLNYLEDMADIAETVQRDLFSEEYANQFLEGSARLREAGIIDALPKQMTRKGVEVYDESGKRYDDLRGKGSHIQAVADLIKRTGGNHQIIATWQQQQAGSSWSVASQALKYHIWKTQGGAADDYYWASGIGTAKQNYEQARKAYGGEVYDKTWSMWHAFVFESLRNMEFEHGRDGYVELVRTEDNYVMSVNNATAQSYTEAHKVKRGAAESGSIYQTIVVKGDRLTLQRVPYHRFYGYYWHEQGAGTGGTGFYGDRENEFVFNSRDLDVWHVGKTGSGKNVNSFWDKFYKENQ